MTLALPPEEAGRSRQLLTEAPRKVLDGRWQLTRITRREDNAGMELVEAAATLRVPEDQASGLSSKLRHAGSAGVKLDLVSVEHKAPTEKLKAAVRAARGRLYKRALEEAALLNEALRSPDRPWEVVDVIVDKADDPRPQRVFRGVTPGARQDPFAMENDTLDGDLNASNRGRVSARVHLQRRTLDRASEDLPTNRRRRCS